MNHSPSRKVKNSIGRLAATLFSVFLQVIWLILLGSHLTRFSTAISTVVNILALMLAIHIYNKSTVAVSFKLPWIMLVLSFPFIGIVLYFLCGQNHSSAKIAHRFSVLHQEFMAHPLTAASSVSAETVANQRVANQICYLSKTEGFPAYPEVSTRFFSDASEAFEAQLDDMRTAQHFIFLEYHAIQDAISFSRMLTLLEDKVASGVEIRILYDDVGSIGFINRNFVQQMEQIGIQCKVFNPVSPVLRVFMNNRDHRKIAVIDGCIGYTGGYNLADEYFNITHPYGHWKDSGIRIDGPAVNSMTAMFLTIWNSTCDTPETDYLRYYRPHDYQSNRIGIVQPYSDSPLDNSFVGENVYLNMIKYAQQTVYITTPYLIISSEMERELIMAAQRGIDVRIVTPGIPDKKLVYRITRSYYPSLVQAGIKIYEYTPGFIHSKQFLVDGELAAVGTINMDFRSFYHHFENGIFLYRCNCIADIQQDFFNLFAVSRNVTSRYLSDYSSHHSFTDSLLRLTASLM